MNTLSTLVGSMALAMTMGLNVDAQDRDPKEERERAYQEQDRSERASNESSRKRMGEKAHNRAGQAHLDQTTQGFLRAKPAGAVSIEHLIGSAVTTPHEDDEIGEVEDILVDRNGRPLAVIISVGGFLGVGDRDVALGWDQVTVALEDDDGMAMSSTSRNASTADTGQPGNRQHRNAAGMDHGDPDDYILVVDVTRDVLESAPQFDRDWD